VWDLRASCLARSVNINYISKHRSGVVPHLREGLLALDLGAALSTQLDGQAIVKARSWIPHPSVKALY